MEKSLKQKNHIARLLDKEFGFINGWRIGDKEFDEKCKAAAGKVYKYLMSKKKRNGSN